MPTKQICGIDHLILMSKRRLTLLAPYLQRFLADPHHPNRKQLIPFGQTLEQLSQLIESTRTQGTHLFLVSGSHHTDDVMQFNLRKKIDRYGPQGHTHSRKIANDMAQTFSFPSSH